MSVTFEHPYDTPTLTLTLKAPSLGNSEKFDIKTQFHVTMDNTPYSHKKTPVKHTLLLNFGFMTKAKIDEMITFFNTSAGDQIRYTDQDSVVWYGYMLTNQNDFSMYGNLCAASKEVGDITLEFDGTPQ